MRSLGNQDKRLVGMGMLTGIPFRFWCICRIRRLVFKQIMGMDYGYSLNDVSMRKKANIGHIAQEEHQKKDSKTDMFLKMTHIVFFERQN